MLVVVAYDIADKRRLRRVMRLMENYGSRRQKNVFECNLNERRFLALRSKMSELIDPEDDRLFGPVLPDTRLLRPAARIARDRRRSGRHG